MGGPGQWARTNTNLSQSQGQGGGASARAWNAGSGSGGPRERSGQDPGGYRGAWNDGAWHGGSAGPGSAWPPVGSNLGQGYGSVGPSNSGQGQGQGYNWPASAKNDAQAFKTQPVENVEAYGIPNLKCIHLDLYYFSIIFPKD